MTQKNNYFWFDKSIMIFWVEEPCAPSLALKLEILKTGGNVVGTILYFTCKNMT